MTLTKQQLLDKVKYRYEEVEVEGWGTIGIRSYDELQRSRRMAIAAEKDDEGDDTGRVALRLFAIIDRVMVDKDTPVFTDADLQELRNADSIALDKLADAIATFDGDEAGKQTGESND